MAHVWLARLQGKHGFQKLFAVKTILPNIAEDGAFKEMFLEEARIASHIDHPNVVHIVDVGEHAGIPYLVMDLIEGEPLHRILKVSEKAGQRIPLGVALRIIADACQGLHAAHELKDENGALMNVVHRDVSPHNVLVTVAGVSKVIDFGIAKARDRTTGETTAGTLKGKVNYMPQEQALGKQVDRRADTWALGAVLYFILTGRPPYKEESQLATLQLVMNAAPIPALPPTIPLTMRSIVMKALAHDPQQRFQTAAELGQALEEAMRKLGITTTHAQVAAFLQQRMAERLETRKQVTQRALAEAANRERAKPELTSPPLLDPGDGSGSIKQAPVSLPTELLSPPRVPDVPLENSSSSGTLAAATAMAQGYGQPAPRRRWPALVAALGAVGVVVGIVGGVGFARLKAQPAPKTLLRAPPAEPTNVPEMQTQAQPPSTASDHTDAPPATATSATASARTAAPKPLPASPQGPIAQPKPQPAPPPPRPATPPKNENKRHDDEAGF
jgi:serine/threonine-protein kinase